MRALSVAFLILLISILGGCREPVVVLPAVAIPGGTVVIKHQDTHFTALDKIKIVFGQKPGLVTRIVDRHRFEALIPDVPRGDTRISVSYDGRNVGTASITVLRPPARRVALEVNGDEFTLVKVQPYGGRFDNPATDGIRLSYDVFDVDGTLAYTSAIPHPRLQQIESFHDPTPHKISRRPSAGSNLILIKVPYLVSKTTVVFYEVRDGVDLTDPQQRENRRRMAEIRF